MGSYVADPGGGPAIWQIVTKPNSFSVAVAGWVNDPDGVSPKQYRYTRTYALDTDPSNTKKLWRNVTNTYQSENHPSIYVTDGSNPHQYWESRQLYTISHAWVNDPDGVSPKQWRRIET